MSKSTGVIRQIKDLKGQLKWSKVKYFGYRAMNAARQTWRIEKSRQDDANGKERVRTIRSTL